MKTIKRDVPGHFICADRCSFFMHTDILSDDAKDAYTQASICVSLIGEYQEGWNNLNGSGKTYELCVFDKNSTDPWTAIFGLNTNDKDEAIRVFNAKVKEYQTAKAVA
jgi:hypothetical protein